MAPERLKRHPFERVSPVIVCLTQDEAIALETTADRQLFAVESISRIQKRDEEGNVSRLIKSPHISSIGTSNISPLVVISHHDNSERIASGDSIFSYGINLLDETGVGGGKGDTRIETRPILQPVATPLSQGVMTKLRVLKIATGEDHCLIIARDHFSTDSLSLYPKLYSFGSNKHGQLGLGRPDIKFSRSLQRVRINHVRHSADGSGGKHSRSLNSSSNDDSSSSSSSGIAYPVEIACGSFFSLIIAGQDRQVYSFGCGAYYRLGLCDDEIDNDKHRNESSRSNDNELNVKHQGLKAPKIGSSPPSAVMGCQDRYAPSLVSSLGAIGQWQWHEGIGDGATPGPRPSGAKLCACGTKHAVVVADGTNDVYTWGWGQEGQLGHTREVKDRSWTSMDRRKEDFEAMVPLPRRVSVLDDDHLLGDNTDDDEALGPGPNNIVQVACGSRHTAIRTACGRLILLGQVAPDSTVDRTMSSSLLDTELFNNRKRRKQTAAEREGQPLSEAWTAAQFPRYSWRQESETRHRNDSISGYDSHHLSQSADSRYRNSDENSCRPDSKRRVEVIVCYSNVSNSRQARELRVARMRTWMKGVVDERLWLNDGSGAEEIQLVPKGTDTETDTDTPYSIAWFFHLPTVGGVGSPSPFTPPLTSHSESTVPQSDCGSLSDTNSVIERASISSVSSSLWGLSLVLQTSPGEI